MIKRNYKFIENSQLSILVIYRIGLNIQIIIETIVLLKKIKNY